jgi:hypothetical protein
MKFKGMTTIFAFGLFASGLALTVSLSRGAASVSASSDRNGELHLTKDCSTYTGGAGDFCTITSSNLAAIVVGSKIFYDQAAGIPIGMVDSNAVIEAGNGQQDDWPLHGRCG